MWSDLDRPPLREGALRRGLVAPNGPYAALSVVEAVTSTNAALAAAARDGAPDRTVLLAEHQTAGRGRLGRSWQAPPRSGLALSVLLRPDGVSQTRWGWIPLLAGVALSEVVTELGEIEAVLKWPNDVLLGPRRGKVAGILAEAVGKAVVLGIGLNVSLRVVELPVPEATSLAIEEAACTDRDTVARALLRRLDEWAVRWCAAGGDAGTSGLRDAYRVRCATLGEPVRVQLADPDPLVGTAVDVDAEGRLVLETAAGHRAISAGDVTHLRAGSG